MNVGNIYVTTRLKDKATKDFKKSMGIMRNSAIKFMGVFAAFKGLQVGVRQVSDLAEAQDSLNRLIGVDGVKALEKFSNTAVQTAGMTRADALTTANNFAGLFTMIPEGAINTGQALGDLMQRVADLGSQFNRSNEEISTGLQSALAGRISLTLQQMGIRLDATSMQTRLAAGEFASMGFAATQSWASIAAGDQVLLRYQAFMNQSKKSAGNFVDTLGISLPNKMKLMKAQLLETAATLSKALMPVLLKLVPILTRMAEWVSKNTGLIGALAGAFAAFKVVGFVAKMAKAIMALYAFAVAKAGAEGGIAGVITAGVVAGGLAMILGGIAGGMFFGGGGSSSGSASAGQKSQNTVVINVSGGANIDGIRDNGGNFNVQTNHGSGHGDN